MAEEVSADQALEWVCQHAMKIATETGCIIADKVEYAHWFPRKLVGLACRPSISPGEGVVIKRCAWVHTFFMRFAIDILYLNNDARILRIDRSVPPWRLLGRCHGAATVVELPAGSADMRCLAVGDRLVLLE